LVDELTQKLPLVKFDVVAITVNTPNAQHVYRMAARYRELGAWVVLGGPHVTLLQEEAMQYGDTIFIGEAEETWPQFLQDFLLGQPNPTYRCDKAPSLKGLPIPRRDLISGHLFTKGAVFASRGCPHHCNYCSLKKIYCPQFRTRPVEEVVTDVSAIAGKFFVFWDDNFFADVAYTKELLKAIRPLHKRWAAQVTAHSCLDDELLSLAAQAGCLYLFLGLESFSSQGLVDANKVFNPIGRYKEIVDKIHLHGICVQAGVVFGFDSDQTQVFQDTLEFCEDLGLDGVTPSILTPFPGTDIYHQYAQEGRLLPVDWSYFNGKTRVAFRPKGMTPEELLQGYNLFRREFYSLSSIARRLAKSRTNLLYNSIVNIGYWSALV